ncbi:MAG TPA: AAA family ATPase [Thermoanaerobaculia bacterium]|nr:AAA family ATPase [Thermoanaerobaculia bacterium]
MRLSKVTLKGYRSVPGDLEVFVRPNMTCMIGANEHGKTNILDAASLLKAGVFNPYDKNANSKDRSHPEVAFTLAIDKGEKASLIASLKEEIAALSEKSEDKAKSQTQRLLDASLAHYQSDSVSSNQLTILLKSNGHRLLNLRSAVFYIHTETSLPFLHKWYMDNVPMVYLFESPKELTDSITLEELDRRANLPFEGILKIAGVWEEHAALFSGDVAAHRLLQAAGRRLTRKIKQIWSQGAAHSFRFDESNGKLHLSIEDPTTFDIPSRRSLGFRSFFSFYLTLYAETDEVDPEGYILLFDEPGIHLHPQGQKDLLRELRRLSRRNQLMYTTHSPFMVDRNDPGATLLVRKGFTKKEKGTRVLYKPYGANWAPLASALGISPADALFPPEAVLLVEGTSDRLYLTEFMRQFQDQTRADLNLLYVLDADRRGEMEAYVRMLLALDRKVVVLADGDEGGMNFQKRLAKIAGAKSGSVDFIDLRKIVGASKEVSIEDVLPREQWYETIRQYVKEILRSDSEIDSEAIEQRSLKISMGRAAAEHLFDRGILAEVEKFSKTTVAALFCQRPMPVQGSGSLISSLCREITRKLGIAEE